MSIEARKPTKEFYSALDEVITHQIKSREAFDKAIQIGRKQGYDDFTIGLFIKDYLKERIPKTSLYRYLKELNPDNNSVPMEQISYNNVLEQKDTQKDTKEDKFRYEDYILDRIEDFNSTEKYILDTARLFRKLGYSEDRILIETKRLCKSAGMGETELEYLEEVLNRKYDLYRKLDNFPGEQPAPVIVQHLKIAVTLDIYGIPRDQISAKIKEIVIPIQGMEYSYFIDYILQPTPFADPNIAEMDFLGVWINSISPRKYGGYIPDDRFEAEQAEMEIGIGNGIKCNVDEKYCRHCIMK